MTEFLRLIAKIIVKTIMVCFLLVISPTLIGMFLVYFSKGEETELLDFVLGFIKD